MTISTLQVSQLSTEAEDNCRISTLSTVPTTPFQCSSRGIKMVLNHTLMKIGAIGGFITASTGYAFRYRIQNDIKKTETYEEAMNALRNHKKAIPYFGEPIRLGHIKYGDGQRMLEHTIPYKWFEIPVTGSNTKGNVYYEVTLNQKLENKPEVSKIEVRFDNLPGKTFVIRDYEI